MKRCHNRHKEQSGLSLSFTDTSSLVSLLLSPQPDGHRVVFVFSFLPVVVQQAADAVSVASDAEEDVLIDGREETTNECVSPAGLRIEASGDRV